MHDLGPKQLPDAYMECGSQPANITMYAVAKDIPATESGSFLTGA